MTNGKCFENIDYHGISFGRDGLDHGGTVDLHGFEYGAKNLEWTSGDWDEGLLLEQCYSEDCFFGCGGNRSFHIENSESKRVPDVDYEYEIDNMQPGRLNILKECVSRNSYIESTKAVRYAKHILTLATSDC